jgi:uncharacterized protein YndB with AHSA1/START domain
MSNKITVEASVKGDLAKVWDSWTNPEHIVNWNFAGDDWHCPKATNDPRTGGKFSSTMASRDGAMGFDFEGVYDEVIDKEKIAYSLADGREVSIHFQEVGDTVKVTEIFDPENQNPVEMQQQGWQMIMDRFKVYTESL